MTSVMGQRRKFAAQCVHQNGNRQRVMQWVQLPTGENKPSWAALFGAVPMVYLFFDPYQRNAPLSEWLWTGLALGIFLILYFVAAIHWSKPAVMARVCVAMTVLAVAFSAYRYNGILFFIYVAAFGPIAVGGNMVRSAAIIGGAILLMSIEWALLRAFSAFPFIVAIEALLIGGATTFVARQQAAMRNIHKAVERERIARDLHDILGHTLSVVILKSELAGRLLEQNPGRAKAEIEEVERIARNALTEVREAIVGYRTGDLLAELSRCQSTLETAGLVVERQVEAVDLPLAHERAFALIAREAVTNIVRHANAKRCHLILKKVGNQVQLEIRDDGKGGEHREGMGMRGIRERVIAIGGTLSWHTEAGTTLTIAIPLAVGESA
jgi:two-component system sensor histidine kinase DesK